MNMSTCRLSRSHWFHGRTLVSILTLTYTRDYVAGCWRIVLAYGTGDCGGTEKRNLTRFTQRDADDCLRETEQQLLEWGYRVCPVGYVE